MAQTSPMAATLEEQLAALPTNPGVYIYKDAQGKVLYVGKAKRLRVRVLSYFRQNADLEPAKQQMVKQIAQVDTITCDTENEALILEANLIRRFQPPYNVVLTDDKYYLFIKITKDKLPRIFPVRRIKQDGARYFGPYSSARAVRQTLKLLRRLFPYYGEKATDKTWIFPHPLFASNAKSALSLSKGKEEQLTIDQESYKQNIHNIIKFLEGDRRYVMETLRQGMRQASVNHEYERAALFRDQLDALERLEGSQKVYLPRNESFDVISLATTPNQSAANLFSIRQGKLLNKNTFLLRHRSATTPQDILRQFILQYYSVAQDIPRLLLIPVDLPDQTALSQWINADNPPTLLVPERGKKKQLLEMGVLNAEQLLREEEINFVSAKRNKQALAQLAQALGLTHNNLERIETYDISNIQGTLTTGSMVVFVDGQPAKQHYKKFKLHREGEPNDFASLQEVIRRRFSDRHLDWPAPNLIIIDGGKGQLSAATQVLAELGLPIPIISLAKREEEIFKPGQSQSIRLPYDSDALFLLQRMRDEAHRFTITYHRLLRSKKQQRSILDEVPGIGPKLKKRLLNRFGSLKAIKAASDAELAEIIGSKVQILRDYI